MNLPQREIKFRAWTGTQMEYNVLVGAFGNFYINPGKGRDGLDENDKASLTPYNTKYPETTPAMQYTGLKDKNDKEIYEGDIVKVRRNYSYGDGGGVRQVVFEGGMFGVLLDNGRVMLLGGNNYSPKAVEVIGNIYENGDLLK